MSITAECPDCLRAYDVPEKYAGKTIRCKACGGAIPIEMPYRDLVDDQSAFGPAWTQEEGNELSERPDVKPRSAESADGTSLRAVMSPKAFWIPIATAFGILLLVLLISTFFLAGLFLGFVLSGIGILVMLASRGILAVESLREKPTQALLVMFVPFYPLYYQISRWPRTQLSVQVTVIGTLIVLLSPIAILLGGIAGIRNIAPRNVAQNQAPGHVRDLDGVPEGGRADRPPRPPQTHTRYLTGTRAPFDPTADHAVEIDQAFQESEHAAYENYVPGSAKFDFRAGTFTCKTTPRSVAPSGPLGEKELLAIGISSSAMEPLDADSWSDPTRIETVIYEIVETTFLHKMYDPLDEAVEQALTGEGGQDHLPFNYRQGCPAYVAGSLDINLESKRVAFQHYPVFQMEQRIRGYVSHHGIEFSPKPIENVDPTKIASSAEDEEDSTRLEPRTVTSYLVWVGPAFDPKADHMAVIEEYLEGRDGYVPGSAKLDLDAGTFSYRAVGNRLSDMLGLTALLKVGIWVDNEPPRESWINPTRTETVTYKITATTPPVDESEDRIEDVVEEALTSDQQQSYQSYVTGSLEIDLKNEQVAFRHYPYLERLRFIRNRFSNSGITLAPNPVEYTDPEKIASVENFAGPEPREPAPSSGPGPPGPRRPRGMGSRFGPPGGPSRLPDPPEFSGLIGRRERPGPSRVPGPSGPRPSGARSGGPAGPDGDTKTVTYEIVDVNERIMQYEDRLDRASDKSRALNKAADEKLARFGGRYGYVPGSIKIDLKNKQVTFQCNPERLREIHLWGQLMSMGIEIERPDD